MKAKAKIFIIYFPVILVSFQVLVNVLYFIAPDFYYSKGFYLNTFFGTNMLYALFLFAFTFVFKFCEVSRWAAAAEVLFAIIYMIIKEDNIYNILCQCIIGVLAIALTFRHYIKKFPLCKLSLLVTFMSSLFAAKGDCKKGVERFEKTLLNTIEKKHHETNH